MLLCSSSSNSSARLIEGHLHVVAVAVAAAVVVQLLIEAVGQVQRPLRQHFFCSCVHRPSCNQLDAKQASKLERDTEL
jgi:hypothetical protein